MRSAALGDLHRFVDDVAREVQAQRIDPNDSRRACEKGWHLLHHPMERRGLLVGVLCVGVAEPLVQPDQLFVIGVEADEEHLGARLADRDCVHVAIQHVQNRRARARLRGDSHQHPDTAREKRIDRPGHQPFGTLRHSPIITPTARNPGVGLAEPAGPRCGMPEMPEVQALADDVRRVAVGQRVARVELASLSALKTYDPPVTALEGATLVDVRRHGKFLDFVCTPDPAGDPLHLVVHLARAGWLHWRDQIPAAPPKPGKGPLAFRVGFVDEDGTPAGGFDLTEAGTQKKLAVYVVNDPNTIEGVARLGPDPMAGDFTVDSLRQILETEGRRQLKGVLRDQSVLAGIGNAYSDEILHVARLSPFKSAAGLSPAEVDRLHAAIRDTLTDAITRSSGLGAAALKAEKKLGMRVHGRTGQPCPECGDVVREVSFADSSLQYCATCQTGGDPLADRRMSRLLK